MFLKKIREVIDTIANMFEKKVRAQKIQKLKGVML